MSIYRELAYDRVISGIKGIQFCILSEQDMRRRSVVEVTENQTFMGNEPVQNGLFDLRMGVVDGSRVCATCQQRNTFCPGHFGHIALARPVFYIQFFDVVRKLMKCACFRCSRILVDLDGPEARRILNRKISRQKRWDAMSKLCSKVKRCGADTVDGCGAKVPDKVVKTEDMRLKLVWKDAEGGGGASNGAGREIIFNAEDVLRVLRRISDLDCEALGFSAEHNRPERMICTVLPVPPPAVRPSVRHETGQRQEDDLTHKLSDIIKRNNIIKDCIARGTSTYHTIETMHVPLLQYHVATLIDNSIPTMFQAKDRAGRAFRSLTERLKHKEGRIRGNLMGKRVDFSARTVITPDPNLSIDELGVPLKIAMNLTFPEIVGPNTRAELQRLVLSGPDVYPGAKQVRKAAEGNRTIRLRGHPDPASIVLEDGDVVERHLLNGDWVLFNRQPSLHKMSMMAHRVRVMPYHTFRLNVMACSSYNADFDGDEMNMHVPQSLQTQYELKELAAVPLHVLSPRYSRPIIGPVQDVALGVFRITQPGVSVSQRQLYNLSCGNQLLGGFVTTQAGRNGALSGNRWTGREVLSTVLPPTASMRMKTEDDPSKFVADVHDIRVVDGIIKSGVLSEKVFSKASTGLVHSTYNTLGPDAVIAMLNSTQKLICDWLVLSGFSVGVADMVIKRSTVDKKHGKIAEAKLGVLELLRKVHAGAFENNSTKSDADMLEEKIGGILSGAATEAYKLCRSGFDIGNNRLLNMIESGSKGKTVNFQQMTACLGPQSIEGRRVTDGFNGRTLPHFTKYDDGPEARGFVEHSFIEGLTPHEFFFHSMAGRIGLIDTAVRSVTWETPVVVVEAGKPKRVLIGEWIDGLLEEDGKKGDAKVAKCFPAEKNLELLDLDREVYIPTLDGKGAVTWGLMTAVTRHDPGERLYRVVTEGGRKATVAESKSLLVWNEEKQEFLEKDSREVKVGDFLPTLMKLPDPPVLTTYVDMTEYLPKKEYIYGTDFNLARRMIHEAQGTRHKIPVGWWEAHNGNHFTLPYTKKASVTRAEGDVYNVERASKRVRFSDEIDIIAGRSNVDNVREGCVYPYHATRCCGHLPDKFELDEENGIFIGLFLADGHTCEPSGVVGISKNDVTIQNWVKAWFEKHGFKTRLANNTNDLGTSYTMFGYSQLFARFIDAFVGHGSRDKHVPDVAFTAPLPFVRGLLNGYISGDGHITNGGVNVSSVSQTLIDGISMLSARLGAFGRINVTQQKTNNRGTVDIAPMNHLSVRGQWGQIFKEQIELVHPEKKASLAASGFTLSHLNFDSYNDVVKDPVKSIEFIGVEKYPKLYDVTVPSTLNFILANGLGVQDTSETGYMQRRLVKAMEDCKIAHDLTVRNANNFIIQFLYGEDGMDAIKLEYHDMKHVLGREPADLRDDFLLVDPEADLERLVTREVLEKMKKETSSYRTRCADHFKKILDDRRKIITGLYKGLQENLPIVYPVNVLRIVEQAASLHAKQIVSSSTSALSDLDPLTILDSIEDLSKQLVVGGAASVEETKGVRWMPVLLRVFLSPKQILRKHRLDRAAFDRVVGEIRKVYFGSVAHPGEQCGVVSAQSLGEPLSQLVLNSVAFDTEIMLRIGSTLTRRKIGELIEEAIAASDSSERLESHPDDTTLLWLKDGGDEGPIHSGLEVLSTDEDGRVMWKEVTAVTRHPVVNKDGSDTLIEVTTESGRSVIATKGKSFLTRRHNKLVATEGEDLQVGDYLPMTRTLKIEADMDYLDVDTYLPRTEFLYQSELVKAIECSEKSRNWYKGPPGSKNVGNGYDFIVPHQRSDSLLVCVEHNKAAPTHRQFRSGCLYPKQQGSKSRGHFPERIELDELFGFYIGAYLSEGSEGNMQVSDIGDRKRRIDCDVDQVHISNIDKDYQQRIIEFAEKYEFGWHLADNTKSSGRSEDICIHSKVISELTVRMCGRGAPNKRVPPELIGANKEFLKGLIDGYFSGDGTCGGYSYIVSASSVSRGLVEDIANILLRFDIGCSFRTLINKMSHTEKGSPIYPCHSIYVRNGDALRFAETFTLTKKAKQTKLVEMKSVVMQNPSYHTPEDVIPSIDIPGSGTTIDVTHRDELPALRYALSNEEDRHAIDMAMAEEVWYDKIVLIKDVPNPKGPYVYDLTVRDTRTFVIWNGMSARDTFHTSGIGGGSANVTSGVPRMKEIMSMSKNIKTPSMKIRLRREWATSQERTQAVLSTIETTHFRDVVKRTSVHFDPSDMNTRIKEDEGLMAFYRDFAGTTDSPNSAAACPWVLRFEFDRMKMLNLQVTMLDLEYALVDHFDDAVAAVLSDDNADRLVCRLRLNAMGDLEESTDLLTEMKAMEQAVMDQLVIKGIKGIDKAVPLKPSSGLKKYDAVSDAYVMDDEWYIETAGTNLMEVLCHPCVDYARTYTNDVYEIYRVLGIEAARQAVINEMRAVLDSTPIDHRHLSLLADTMSNRGFFMSIDRHGINNRGELGPLAKASFEQSTDMLIKAGIFSERDRINGVSANIMLGQVAPCGTGDCTVLMDNDRLATLGKPVSLDDRPRGRVQAQPPLAPIVEVPELTELTELTELPNDADDKKEKKIGRRKKVEEIEIV